MTSNAERRVVAVGGNADHLEHPLAHARSLLGGRELEIVEAEHRAHGLQMLAVTLAVEEELA